MESQKTNASTLQVFKIIFLANIIGPLMFLMMMLSNMGFELKNDYQQLDQYSAYIITLSVLFALAFLLNQFYIKPKIRDIQDDDNLDVSGKIQKLQTLFIIYMASWELVILASIVVIGWTQQTFPFVFMAFAYVMQAMAFPSNSNIAKYAGLNSEKQRELNSM